VTFKIGFTLEDTMGDSTVIEESID